MADSGVTNIAIGIGSTDVPIDIDDPSIGGDTINEPDTKRQRGGSPKGDRVNRSKVWDHFFRPKNADGTVDMTKAICNYCDKLYAANSNSNGTSTLMAHITKQCRGYEFSMFNLKRKGDKRQTTLWFEPVSQGGVAPKLTAVNFSVEACRKALAEMIILDELPFRFADGVGFRKFIHVVQPKWSNPPGRLVVAKDCIKIYQDQKKSLKKALKNQRICLTSDTWTSLQNLNYMCLTAHYIDSDWKLHKKIINFCLVPNHKGETLGIIIDNCLVEWGISKILTITLDNASSNNGIIDYFKKKNKTKPKDSTILEHEYLHVRCCAHVLNLVVRDGLKEVDVAVARVRNMVRYVRSSPQRYAKFRSCCDRDEIKETKVPCLDVATRWNSTLFMLERALLYQQAFDRLEYEDRLNLCVGIREDEVGIREDEAEDEVDTSEQMEGRGSVGTPSCDDWKVVEMYASVLKVFFQVTEKFSGSLYVTCNTFFKEVMTVKTSIANLEIDDDCKLKLLGGKMKKKFDKYWGDLGKINQLLLFAHVLDPRYKFCYMRWSLSKHHGTPSVESKIVKIKEKMTKLFNWYERSVEKGDSQTFCEPSKTNGNNTKRGTNVGEVMDSEYAQHMQEETNMVCKSELERYWLEANEQPNVKFDVLAWWKANSLKYPIVSQMARDVLAIPVSTVASESAFSTGGRILDPYRTSLSPKTAEALICTQNWLRHPTSISLEEAFEEAEKLEEKILEVLKEDVSSISLL